ncbi:LOW QUALITY PROTEIN: transcription elongation factor GreA [Geomicrobium sp. JCM 19038]|nr:LOW QUALITY PROTEIN: transcription elongation factor GreA [Geomicrobium sp. JCM 19038]
MAEDKKYYMTEEGLQKLEEELEHLKTTRRQEVVERIKLARDFGDLSENSEYDTAKEDQALSKVELTKLRNMIRNSVIIEDDGNNDEVSLGKSVTFKELPDGDEEVYTIVGSAESDPLEGKISNDSPMAQSLLGKRVGDVANVSTPGGDMEVEIINIQ